MYKSLEGLKRILIVPVSGSEGRPWFQRGIFVPKIEDGRLIQDESAP